MNKKFLRSTTIMCSFLFFTGVAEASNAALEPEWFKNEIVCADTQVIIQSFCENNVNSPVNHLCSGQKLILKRPGEKAVVRNLLEKEKGDDLRIATGMRCVSTKKKHYLYISIENGGNCDECEIFAIVDLKGRWRRYGNQWFSPLNEQMEITKSEGNWLKRDSFSISNKIKMSEK